VVLGTCSGGTSAIAGILHHLGVDMGRVSENPSRARGYAQFEDQDLGQFKRDRNKGPRPGGAWTVNQYRFDWLGYQRHRLASSSGPIGVKCSGADLIFHYGHPETQDGIRIVRVLRSLDAVVKKETQRWAKIHLANLEGTELDYAITERAGYAAKSAMATELVCRAIPPAATVRYESALLTTEPAVRDLAKVLGLRPSEEQVEAACRFVRPFRPTKAEPAEVAVAAV
jgi:hypothetical protein